MEIVFYILLQPHLPSYTHAKWYIPVQHPAHNPLSNAPLLEKRSSLLYHEYKKLAAIWGVSGHIESRVKRFVVL